MYALLQINKCIEILAFIDYLLPCKFFNRISNFEGTTIKGKGIGYGLFGL